MRIVHVILSCCACQLLTRSLMRRLLDANVNRHAGPCPQRSVGPLSMVDSAARVQRRAAQTNLPCATLDGMLTLVSRMQAVVLSMVDPAVLPAVEPGCGCAKEALVPLLAWFRGAMRELPPVEDAEDLDLVCISIIFRAIVSPVLL